MDLQYEMSSAEFLQSVFWRMLRWTAMLHGVRVFCLSAVGKIREWGVASVVQSVVQGDSKLLSGFPWPVIFKPETTK
jgi:hypothetical protein